MAEMDQKTKRLSCLDQWPVLQIHWMNPKPSRPTPGAMGWGLGLTGVLPQGHKKFISRSQEGQLSLK